MHRIKFIPVNCSEMRLKSSWMAVELPMNVADILSPLGGMSHTAVFTLFGIHSTKYDEFLFCTDIIWSSTSFNLVQIVHEHDKYLLSEFSDGEGSVCLSSLGRERSEAGHEEVETGEGHHVDGQLAQGSTTVSDTLGEGTTENDAMMRSGYSSRIFEISRVPIPDPVPPPREWVNWKP
ncbi:hypothetical protein WR25_22764 [Diploscapter pachys]|uniref:Uncharacterized protein n=1 Tax=Diploscapter pachys TaxID=2018661 RepID=A0A2A2LRU9_9BILA|nr:hypothetical protein WR25_22764 [Diploscapter pachys]